MSADDIFIRPEFHMPPGVKDLYYIDSDEVDDHSEVGTWDVEDDTGDSEFESEFSSADENNPYPPDYLEIISQTVRTLPGGGQVVDVTIELPDLDEGDKYEVKVSK